ncbi:hypothetical protein D1164_03335 [Mariniphaga sediminis]|uniref:Uncharacterized protein n=1 Tax=Mariniphaga sediminis TaxID=1628158 RepID=A0A399D3Y3_9BACT|nr:hypothetical protein [Mariniphaga sediminis]RIH66645.1 hypothetical protein D1164_03335 [Mariniphaga sediminis]
MKNKNSKIHRIIRTAFAVILTVSLAGCNYLDNPLKDKETGEDINLLVLDFNFFNTRISVKLLDAKDGSLITSPATIRFTGENGNDIVTFSGDKKPEFTTSQGQLEVTVDPNVSISESSPFTFAVNVEVDGYNTLSKGFQFQAEGKKTIELQLSKIADEEESEMGGEIIIGDGDTTFIVSGLQAQQLKSAAVEEKPYKIQYEFTPTEILKFEDAGGNLLFQSKTDLMAAYAADPENFIKLTISKFSDYKPETDVVNIDGNPVSVLFHKLETGKLTSLTIGGKVVADLNGGKITSTSSYTGLPAPDLFGFAQFSEQAWDISGTENSYTSLNFSYTLVKASTEPLCPAGSSITFKSNVISSFSIDADVYDNEDNLITTLNFKGSFPETFEVENTPQKAVKLVFRDNNPAFQPIAPLEIADFCSGNYEVTVSPTEGYKEYQIVLKAFCPDNPTIAVAPTYSGELRIKNSDNPWQGADMTGGVVDLLGLPDQEYQYRLLWEDEWEYSALVTEFDENGNYLHESGSNIHSELLEDGRVRIYVEHNFSQDVCDDLGW